ncbi:DNA-entry nuclease [Cohnella abietis]|uniref:DNA-entry nuclease n=1 Tax=Cohnella abietis TaxID=2507935 RepID=A0A3T1D356_9BACL|nr:DNA-entry nuclease [Cohnella abietis]BBI32459.1 hypothetical protein KCTCHS21_18580 [Cohnella abietis]
MRETKQRRKVLDENDRMDGITFDKLGRMNYHPDFHTNHKSRMSLDEIIYMCKYYEIDGPRTISFAIGRTEHTVMSKVYLLRKAGNFEKYKFMTDDEWLELIS